MPLPLPPRTLLRDAALFLDFDGTLVPIADRPDGIAVDAKLLPLLERLQEKLAGRLTLISGRATADVRRWLAPLKVAIVGSHGLERDGLAVGGPLSLPQFNWQVAGLVEVNSAFVAHSG